MPSSKFDQDEQYEEETLTIVDETGRSLSCYIEQSLEIDNMTYLLLVPADIPVVVMSINNDSDDELEAAMLDDDEAIAEIFDNAKAVLARTKPNPPAYSLYFDCGRRTSADRRRFRY